MKLFIYLLGQGRELGTEVTVQTSNQEGWLCRIKICSKRLPVKCMQLQVDCYRASK